MILFCDWMHQQQSKMRSSKIARPRHSPECLPQSMDLEVFVKSKNLRDPIKTPLRFTSCAIFTFLARKVTIRDVR